jgi:16S rRNA (guanine527-N7)-methyltransferase
MVNKYLDLIFKYFPKLSDHQQEQLSALGGLYEEWNKKINVISRKDIDNLYLHHVLHSLSIAKYVQFVPKAKVIDIGTGGGFPGVPLAILFPETQFTLLDGTRKKLKVIDEVSETIGLKNVKTIHQRAEEHKLKYHFVVTRAMANMTKLYSYSQQLIEKTHCQGLPNGLIALKGGLLEAELKEARIKHEDIVNLTEYFEEDFFETKQLIYIQI